MKKGILGILTLLLSISSFANSYVCTINTNDGVKYDQTTGDLQLLDNYELEGIKIKVGDNLKEFRIDENKKVLISLEDGDLANTEPAGIYSGMNMLTVRFFDKSNQKAFVGVSVSKDSNIIQHQSGRNEVLINVFCEKR